MDSATRTWWQRPPSWNWNPGSKPFLTTEPWVPTTWLTTLASSVNPCTKPGEAGPADRDWDDSNFCIMELYAQFWGDWHDYHGSYTWQALGNALDQCGITIEGPLHRALADARGALAVLQYIAAADTEAF